LDAIAVVVGDKALVTMFNVQKFANRACIDDGTIPATTPPMSITQDASKA
jgi:hypothetical protein